MGAFFGYASLMPHSVTHPARAYTGHMDMTGIVSLSWWMVAPLIALGSLLHFLYDWTGQKRWAAVIGAVNESYWEHIKIAVWPVVLLQVILFALGGYHYPAFIPAATVAIYSLPISMIGIVWLYKAFTKRNILWLDMTDDFLAPDGTLPKELFPDSLHPSPAGYRKWSARLKPLLDQAL